MLILKCHVLVGKLVVRRGCHLSERHSYLFHVPCGQRFDSLLGQEDGSISF